jgi:hypothetical protein
VALIYNYQATVVLGKETPTKNSPLIDPVI